MNNELQIFNNPEFGTIRAMEIGGEPWFVGKDVATALGYSNTKDALASHVDAEDKRIFQRSENATFEVPNRGMTIINESGLYSLTFSSKLLTAKKFKRWVTSEVLPSIRKTGGYIAGQEHMSDAELMAKAIEVAQKTLEAREKRIAALESENHAMQPKAIFADAVAASDSPILIGELAKILKQNGVDTGQNRLFDTLRKEGFLIAKGRTDSNMPTQRAMELGLFKIKETAITHSDGHVTVNKTVKVTGKGQQYFINRYLPKAKKAEEQSA